MSADDAYQDDMERISQVSVEDVERLLGGKALPDDTLEDVAAFVRGLQRFAEEPATETAARHIAAIVDAAQAGATDQRSPGRVRSFPLPFRRNLMRPTRLSPTRLKLLVTTVGALLLAGLAGAAYAGDLPKPIQGGVANLAQNVGLSLPGKSDDDAIEDESDTRQLGNTPPSPITQITGQTSTTAADEDTDINEDDLADDKDEQGEDSDERVGTPGVRDDEQADDDTNDAANDEVEVEVDADDGTVEAEEPDEAEDADEPQTETDEQPESGGED